MRRCIDFRDCWTSFQKIVLKMGPNQGYILVAVPTIRLTTHPYNRKRGNATPSLTGTAKLPWKFGGCRVFKAVLSLRQSRIRTRMGILGSDRQDLVRCLSEF
jgi:hypothetical protein